MTETTQSNNMTETTDSLTIWQKPQTAKQYDRNHRQYNSMTETTDSLTIWQKPHSQTIWQKQQTV